MIVVINSDVEGLRLNLWSHRRSSSFYGDVQQTLLIIWVWDLRGLSCERTLYFVKSNRRLIVLYRTLRRGRIRVCACLCAVKDKVLSCDIADRCIRNSNLRVCPPCIISCWCCVVVDSGPILSVSNVIPICIMIREVLPLVTRLHQLILNLLMKTVNSRIIPINRSRSNIIWLLVGSSILKYLVWRFNLVIRTHHSVTILKAHIRDHLLGVSLHIIRLRGCASIGVWSSHDVRIEFSLWVGACCHSPTTNLRRRRMGTHLHLDVSWVEISGCLVHKILSHCNCSASRRAHQRLLLVVNRLLPWSLCVLKNLLLLLKHHPNIRLVLLLFRFLKFQSVARCEIHKRNLNRVGGLSTYLGRPCMCLAHRSGISLDVVVVLGVLEVCSHLLLMMESSSSIVSRQHMWYRMSLVR